MWITLIITRKTIVIENEKTYRYTKESLIFYHYFYQYLSSYCHHFPSLYIDSLNLHLWADTDSSKKLKAFMVWFLPLYIGKGKTCCFDEIFRLIFPGIYPSYISVESYDIYAVSFPTNYPSFYRLIYSVLFIIYILSIQMINFAHKSQ